MKPIALPFHVKLEMAIDPAKQDQVQVTWNPEELTKRKDRGLRVISSAIAIETIINDLLRATLFRELKADLDFVSGIFLESDKISFSNKRKILIEIIEKESLLAGPSKPELEKNLRDVMRYRNAFAHGSIVIIGSNYELQYFETSKRHELLNEEFWDKIEKIFNDAFNTLNQLIDKITPQPSA